MIALVVVTQRIVWKIQDDKLNKEYEDSVYYQKVLNAPVRSIDDYNVTEDTAFIRRLEDSTKR